MIIQKELISVVIPVYNVELYLKKCINSVLQQTYKNIEIILVNDGSTDNCKNLCDEFKSLDSRVKVFHKENGGLSDARNYGIKHASGYYITFIDSDDYVKNDFIEKLYNSITYNKCDIAICSHEDLYPNRVKKYNLRGNCINEKVMGKEEALKHMLYKDGYDVSAWAKLYKKSLFKEILFPKGRLFEDAATTYKLILLSEKIVYVNYIGYEYVIRKNSISNEGFNKKKFDLILSTNEMCDEIDKVFPKLKDATIRRRVYANFSTLRFMKNIPSKYNKEIDNIVNTINKYRMNVLLNKNASKRDKCAILSLVFGKKVFFYMWDVYSYISGRK